MPSPVEIRPPKDSWGTLIPNVLEGFQPPEEVRGLPTTPKEVFIVQDEMPEPSIFNLEVSPDGGMSIYVGDFKQVDPETVSFTTLSHNLRRGATWAGRQGLELFLHQYRGFFK